METLNFNSISPKQIDSFTKHLVGSLNMENCLWLNGDLGSGKTHFVRSAIKHIQSDQVVTSPTYSLVEIYHLKINIYHCDLYRINHSDEIDDLGLSDATAPYCLFIEWAERFQNALPAADLIFEFSTKQNTFNIQATANSLAGELILKSY